MVMLSENSEQPSGESIDKREELSRKITQLVDDLPLFPTDVDRLLVAAIKKMPCSASAFSLWCS
jgi:hypothetical protein